MMSYRPGAIAVLTLLAFLLFGSAAFTCAQPATHLVENLKSGETVQRPIKAGESQSFYVRLRKGEFYEVEFWSSTEPISVSFPSLRSELHPANKLHSLPGKALLRTIAEETELRELNIYCVGRTGSAGDYTLTFRHISSPSPYLLKYARLQWTHDRLWGEFYKKTIPSVDYVVKTAEQALIEWRELQDPEYLAKTSYQLGEAYLERERFPEAMRAFNEALPYFVSENDFYYQATVLNSLGHIYASWGDYSKAIEVYQKALPLWMQEVGNPSMNMIGWNMMYLGHAYRSFGDWSKASEYYAQARKYYAENMQAVGLKESLLGQGVVAGGLGSISLAKGDKQAALDQFKNAVEFFRGSEDTENEYLVYYRIGEVYSSLGDYDQARRYFDRALEHYGATESLAEASILTAYGNLHRLEGETDSSLAKLNRSFSIRRKLGDRRGQAISLTALGATYAAQRQIPQALQNYREAQDLWKEIGDLYNQGATLNYLGLALVESKDAAAAREAFNRSLELRRKTFDREGEADTLYRLARLDVSADALSSAKEKIDKALSLSEAVRASVNGDDLRARYLATVRDYYDFYLDLLMKLHQKEPGAGFPAEAFRISEMARARSLLESLSALRLDDRIQANSKLLNREQQLQNSLNAKAEYIRNLRLKKSDGAQIDSAEKAISSLIEQIQEVRGQIRAANPRFAELAQARPADIRQIQDKLLDRDTLLVSYSLGRENSYVWLVSQAGVSIHQLPPRKEIEDVARRVHNLLTQRQVPGQTTLTSQLETESRRLSELILGPVAEKLNHQRLLIIADGALQYIPFGMLPVSSSRVRTELASGPYLINDHEIINVPSASALLAMRERVGPEAGSQIAVIADPVFDRFDGRVADARAAIARGGNIVPAALSDALRDVGESSLPRLIKTRDEALSINQFAPQGAARISMNFAARRESLTEKNLLPYRIIHIATHGLLDSRHPELSGLVFSLVDEKGAPRDGFLRLHEIYNLKLNAELVVLSACQTGLGKEIRGEGLVGLTRGFMYAGATRVVASLWKVDDSATAELMKLFYQELLGPGKASPAAALRTAQLKLMQQRRWSNPNAWAAFTLQGEWK